jgi:uncharacterized protein (TIGR03435 family)
VLDFVIAYQDDLVTANDCDNLRREQMLLMAQSLLAERFKRAAHVETREMPIYDLVVAKGGPKLTVAKELQPGDDAPTPAASGKPPSPLGMRQGTRAIPTTKNVMEMTAKGQTFDDFAQMPVLGLGSPVVNRTTPSAPGPDSRTWDTSDLNSPPSS